MVCYGIRMNMLSVAGIETMPSECCRRLCGYTMQAISVLRSLNILALHQGYFQETLSLSSSTTSVIRLLKSTCAGMDLLSHSLFYRDKNQLLFSALVHHASASNA